MITSNVLHIAFYIFPHAHNAPFWHAALPSNHLHEVDDDEPRNSSKCLDLVRIQVPMNSIALTLIWPQRSHQCAWSDVVPGFDVAASTQPLYNCTIELHHGVSLTVTHDSCPYANHHCCCAPHSLPLRSPCTMQLATRAIDWGPVISIHMLTALYTMCASQLTTRAVSSNPTQLHTVVALHAWDHDTPVIDPHT